MTRRTDKTVALPESGDYEADEWLGCEACLISWLACPLSSIEQSVLWRSLSRRSMPATRCPAFSRILPRFPKFLNGGSPLRWTAYTKHPREYMSEAVFKTSSRAYSGAKKQHMNLNRRYNDKTRTHVVKWALCIRRHSTVVSRKFPSRRTVCTSQGDGQTQTANFPVALFNCYETPMKNRCVNVRRCLWGYSPGWYLCEWDELRREGIEGPCKVG